MERSQSNIVLAWEQCDSGTLEWLIFSRWRIAKSLAVPSQAITNSAGDQREVDAAALTRDTSILVESKSMASIDAVDQIVSLRTFVQ